MEAPFTSYLYEVEVITPVHIGDAKEKELIQGQDYYCDAGKFIFIDKKAVLKKMTKDDIFLYADELSQNKTQESNDRIKKICDLNQNLVISTNNAVHIKDKISKNYTNGLGRVILPGTSLKGAIRSVIAVALKEKNNLTGNLNIDTLFGKIDNNFMRLLQVSDIDMGTNLDILPMKIYSGDVNRYTDEVGVGKWKDAGGHNATFLKKGFETFYETFPIHTKGILRINFGENLLRLVEINRSIKPMNSDFLNALIKNKWIDIVKKHTESYLKKEIKYFQKFKNEHYSNVIDQLNELIKLNNTENQCIMRVGAGSGFHAITGDWKYSDHSKTKQAQEKNRNTGIYENTNAMVAKTRKVVFDNNNKWLPGFIKIRVTSNEELNELNEKLAADIIKNKELVALKLAAIEAQKEIEIQQKLEALLPKMQEINMQQLKSNQGMQIDAIVLKSDSPNIIVKPYLSGYENKEISIRYPAGMEENTAININVKLEGSNLRVIGYPRKKH